MRLMSGERPPVDPRNARIWLRRELVAEGLDDRGIARLVEQEVLSKVRWGAYVDHAVWEPLDAVGRYGLRGRAALLQSRADVVLSHTSALVEHDTPLWGVDLTHVHLTRTDGKAGRKEAGIQQHCGALEEGDVVVRNGVRVTSPTRAALEVTAVASVEAGLCAVNDLLHRGLTNAESLEERYASMDGWPGMLGTEVVLRLADGRVESIGESRTLYCCYLAGLPRPVPQYAVHDANGVVVARVDFAWPDLGVFLEFDGRVKYEKLLRPGERASDVVVREKRREELICRLTGWRCIRVTWDELRHPERLAALLRAALTGPR